MLFIGILLGNFALSRAIESYRGRGEGRKREREGGEGGRGRKKRRNKIEGRRMAEKRGEEQKTNDTKRK